MNRNISAMIKLICSAIIIILSLDSVALAAKPRVLVLTKSQGYEHSTVYRNNGQPSFIDQAMDSLAAKNGFTVSSFLDLAFCWHYIYESPCINHK